MMQPLKAFLIFLLLCVFVSLHVASQPAVNKYEKQWKQVDELVQKQLPKSALQEVKKIYQLAKRDPKSNYQQAQMIKALVYMIELQNESTEGSEAKNIADIDKEISTAGEPARSILSSLLAELYWRYYQQHRWQLYERTNTVSFKKNDIATWTADDFHQKTSDLYLLSIKNSSILQQTPLEGFDAIIVKGNVRHLRPTLFDLLVHRALDYFKNDERDITRPAYAFEIDQAAAFDPATNFAHQKFITKDSLSLQHKALLLYQQLVALHLNDAKPDALIDVDIERIEFVHDKGVQENKEQLYLTALNHIAHQYPNHPSAAQAWYLIAAQYNQDGSTYQPYGDTTHRYDKVKAKEICEKVLLQRDSSEGKINCYNLLNEINRKDLKFSMEKVNTPGLPFRALVEYKNFSHLYLRIVKADEKLKSELDNYYDEKFWNTITAGQSVAAWEQTLPLTNDLQEHSTEIKVNALPAGDYLLLTSTDESFDTKKSLLGARLFYVSNISFVNNGQNYFVLHRETGQPLVNADVRVWEQKYDYKTSKYAKEKVATYKTDQNGFFALARAKTLNPNSANYMLDISYNGERFFMNEYQYYYYYYNNQPSPGEEDIEVFLFTDRSIYRPGQTLYFKGIAVIHEQNKKNSIKAGYDTWIYLNDANDEAIDSMKVKTNDYGSFSGKFQLPQSGLNGRLALEMKDDEGSAYVSMEEYKRPKFYVDYEKMKGIYKVNDNIKVTGFAKAYAGNNIDKATVKYRVVRQPRFIYPWLSWRWWQPPVKEMEIAHGQIQTDKDGKFVIEFTAIPDLTIDQKFEPVFDYSVYADVTDINGETRSGEKLVSVSYKSLMLNVDLPDKLPLDSFKNISITTRNMAGEFQPARVRVTISKLREEKRLMRNRYWERPDQFVMSKEEYVKSFPYDEYDNESDYKRWPKEKTVFEKMDSVSRNSDFAIRSQLPSGTDLSAGVYIVEVTTKDKDGQEVKDVKYVELYDEKSNRLDHPEYLWTLGSKPIEPGEKTTNKIGTSATDVFVIQQIDKSIGNEQSAIGDFVFVLLNGEKRNFDFSATESDRGGYGVNYFFVKNNRFYQFNDKIKVPWTNKDLKIEYATFRDKTLPGSQEKWKVRITGYKNEKVAAEMLASMYDASLDQFRRHKWSSPSVWEDYPYDLVWNGNYDFSQIESIEKRSIVVIKDLNKAYDALLDSRFLPQRGVVFLQAVPRNAASTMGSEVNGALEEVVVAGTRRKSEADSTPGKGYYDTVRNLEGGDVTASLTFKATNPDQGPELQVRKNFNETAFFFPDLHTDSTGAIEFSFTIPEALTRWKLQTLAHTKDLAFGLSTKEVITQKQLMVQPNVPRFLREGDRMELSAKIVNLTHKEFTGQAQLQLFDATTNQPIDGWFQNMFPNQYFTVGAGQTEAVKFPIQVPYLFNKALSWRIVAKTSAIGAGTEGALSDGEEDAMPVLTNKTLVTETLPLNVRGTGTKNFKFDKLLNSSSSQTSQNYALTVEYTSNPAWYAVQSLPYLMEFPYECAEQMWNRYYANSLASMIVNLSPRIKQVFEQWKADTSALLSNLQKNQELKSVLLEETPWVMEAKSEEQQKKNIALLFDMVRMSNELNNSFEKLKQLQSQNGGFVWFAGGPDDRYITQYIISGIGHLRKLKAFANGQDTKLNKILATALPYLDKKIQEDYDGLTKSKTDLKKYVPDNSHIQYLYMRSFFPDYPVAKGSQAAFNYFKKQSQANWTKQSTYMRGMIALSLFRSGDSETPSDILRSLKETAIVSEEMGMYWKDQSRPAGWFWYQAPIERQALLMEAFQEIERDQKTVDELKTWLLKNKQTTNWKTTKATAEACYALLLQGTNWLSNEPNIEIKLGNTTVSSAGSSEAGTGYFKKTIEGEKIIPAMANVSVSVNGAGNTGASSWGAVYWQYFENLDKITTSSTPLRLSKKLFVEKNTDRGPVLTLVNEGDELHVGDKIKVRIELRVDRDMEYVHMKDMRASCLEPVNVLSEYKWQDGLGYYETTKDASTNFFFSYLPKGTFVFEYPLFVTHTGNFSNGITSIQSMYAPEFASHSEGARISVSE
jgi:alpha-2-macroglobulin-like protein/alpha-2-macroglobulin family protein/MG2 domain-containing protein